MIKLLFLFFATTLYISAGTASKIINYKEANRIYRAKSAIFIDARDQKYYKKGTISGAINIPIKRFRRMKQYLPSKKSSKIVVFCNGAQCGKSAKLAKLIMHEGYTNVLIYKNGFPEWKERLQDVMLDMKYCNVKKHINRKSIIFGVPLHLGKESGTIDARWFIKLYKEHKLPLGIALVDVRHPNEYKEGHLNDAKNIEWNFEKGKLEISKFPHNKVVVLYCSTGMRSQDAYDSLDSETKKRVLYIDALIKCKGQRCIIHPN